MKSAFLSLISFFMVFSCFAATDTKYEMNFELLKNGKIVGTAQVMTTANKEATLTKSSTSTKEKLTVHATASDVSNDKIQNGILMNLAIGFTNDDGNKTVSKKATVITKEGSSAIVALNDKNDGTEEFSLKITAVRIH